MARVAIRSLIALLRRRSCVVQQHNIGLVVGTHNTEGLAVGRKDKELDRIALKICNLASLRSIERLPPQVVGSVLANQVNECLLIGRKYYMPRTTWIRIKEFDLRLGAGIERN